MSYATDLEAIARQLAVIAVHGTDTLTSRDLDVALTARAAVLELSIAVQQDLTRHRGRPAVERAGSLESHPVSSFADALRRHPRVTVDVAPSDVVGKEPDSDVGRAWQAVARHAISAHHHWTTGEVTAPGAVAWSGLMDVAAISSVVAELDADLATAARALPGRSAAAASLLEGVTSGLRTAARQVGELAARGPLPDGPQPRVSDNRGLITITRPEDVATAHEQLTNLLRTADHIRPERLALIVIGHLRSCQSVLDVLPAGTPASMRRGLSRHVNALREVTRHPVLAASIRGGDTRAFRQMQIIRQAVGGESSSLLNRAIESLDSTARLVGVLATTTHALRETADRHISTGNWLLPDQDVIEARWRPSQTWHEAPAHLQALRLASVAADWLASELKTSPSPKPSSVIHRAPLAARNLLLPAPYQPYAAGRLGGRPRHPTAPTTRNRR